MTREERKKAIEVLDDMKVKIDIPKAAKAQNDRNWALDIAIQALSQEPCTDAVSRQAVCDALLDYWHDIQFVDVSGYDVYEDCEAVIDELPSVTQKSGKWISEKVDGEDWKGCKRQYYQPISCSKCHSPNIYKTNYCPNCGEKMESEVQTDAT